MKKLATSSWAPFARALRPAGWLRLLAFLLGLLITPARAQQYTWADKTTNTFKKTAVVHDSWGNAYVLTTFTGTTTVARKTYFSLGGADLLLIKYDPNGQVQWTRRIGGGGNERGGSLKIERTPSSYFIYVTGAFQKTVQFESSTQQLTIPLVSAGQSDLFVARYEVSGYCTWRWRAGGAGDDYASDIDTDFDGNVYLTGSFTGTMPVKTAAGATAYFTSQGSTDIFLLKFTTAGSLLMGRRLGNAGSDVGTSLAVEPWDGIVYLTGGLAPAANSSFTDVVVAKYNAAGTPQWVKTAGSQAHDDRGNNIILGNNCVYLTGYFGGSIHFGSNSLTSNGSADAFVASYWADGRDKFFYRYGGTGWDEGHGLANYNSAKSNDDDQVYLLGTFTGKAVFGNTLLSAAGGTADRDLFLASLATSKTGGAPIWSRRLGSTADDFGQGGISVPGVLDPHTIFITGHYGASITLGNKTLLGPGNLVTQITLPRIFEVQLFNAAADSAIRPLKDLDKISYAILGTNQINLAARTTDAVGSVQFRMAGKTWIENGPGPFTYPGEAIRADGSIDYKAFTPLGSSQLLVEFTPYGEPNGLGIKGESHFFNLTFDDRPVVTGLTLINAVSDKAISPLTCGQILNYGLLGTNQLNIVAKVSPNPTGSVKLVLDGVSRIENAAPYTLAGDGPKTGGGIDYKSITLGPGKHTLTVTPYLGANGTGTAGVTYNCNFSVLQSSSRLAAEAIPDAQPALQAAPNPFTGRVTLSFMAIEDAPASLLVYNTQGFAVGQLFEGTLQKGQTYQWAFDGTDKPSGLYFARLKVGGKVYSQRLLLNK